MPYAAGLAMGRARSAGGVPAVVILAAQAAQDSGREQEGDRLQSHDEHEPTTAPVPVLGRKAPATLSAAAAAPATQSHGPNRRGVRVRAAWTVTAMSTT